MTDIDHMIAVMQAAKEGKAIQIRDRNPLSIDRCWRDMPDPSWNWGTREYRVKPAEPRRVWMNVREDVMPSVYTSRSQADLHAARDGRTECVEFVEVVK